MNSRNSINAGAMRPWFIKTTVAALLSGVALSCLSFGSATAQTVGTYTPGGNSNQVGEQTFADGAAHTIGGGYNTIASGNGDWDYPALYSLEQQGRLVAIDGVAGGTVADKETLSIGGRVLNTGYRDPITGATQNISVYNSSNFGQTGFDVRGNETSATTWTLGQDQNFYLDGRIATVTAGSTLDVVVGDPAAEPGAVPGNTLNMYSKQTSVYKAEGAGTINYNSNTQFDLGSSEAESPALRSGVDPATGEVTQSFIEYKFDQGITFPASSWVNPATGATEAIPGGTVTDLATFQNYNNYLIGRLQTGGLNISNYDAELRSAFSRVPFTATYQAAPTAAEAPTLWATLGQRTLVEVDGANAVVNFGQDAKVKDATITSTSHIAFAQNGAVVNNEGKLSSGTQGSSTGWATSGLILAQSGSTVFNRATGSISNYDPGTYQANSTADLVGVQSSVGVMLYDTGTHFENEGIINVAGGGSSQGQGFQAGIYLKNGGPTARNTGIINVAVNGNLSDTTVYGVGMEGTSQFVNDGEIHIGRTGQYSLTDPTTDVANNLAHIYGIGGGGSVEMANNGLITIGSQTHGASAMRMNAGNADSIAVNNGTIDINGSTTGTPLLNMGMEFRNAGGTNVNTGTININGVNAVGIHALSGNIATAVTSTGIINVGGGADPATGTRNFGVWAEGQNGTLTTADIEGQVNLTGVGGIGVHARGTSTVNVSATAAPNFVSGSDQIGFFIHGPDAVVNVEATTMDVATDRSTLFRIAEGADYDASGTTIIASGADSVGILGTGVGTEIHTQDGRFNLTGDGATAVVIEGGATGTILPITTIGLNAANTTAGIVDGQKHDLFGAPVGAPDATTLLTNAADIASTQPGVTGFIARNLGTLDTTGDIVLAGAGSTGILAQDSGKVIADGLQVAVNGWATKAIGGADDFTITNSSLSGTDGLLDVSGAAAATFSADASNLTGRIITAPGSTSNVSLTGSTVWNMDANSNVTTLLNDASTINFTPPVGDAFKTLTVDGNYTGVGGSLAMNTYLGTDGSPSDILHVVGATAGTSSIFVTNAGGPGALTVSNGILLVDVDGASDGAFTLSNPAGQVISGAYGYRLFKNGVAGQDGNWYLRSIYTGPIDPTDPDPVDPTDPGLPPLYQPGVPVYEAYPQVLLGLNGLPTLQQRVGNRYWNEPDPVPETVFCKDPSQDFKCVVTDEQAKYYTGAGGKATMESNAIWTRIEGAHGHFEPDVSTSRTEYESDQWRLQSGLDGQLYENAAGDKLLGGITVHYGEASADISSVFGNGSIDAKGYGVGINATWYQQNGFYVDAQAQATWYDSDLNSDLLGGLTDGNNGFGYALSLEAGKRIQLNEHWAITPQAQLVYSAVDFDTFTGPSGERVSLSDGDSLNGRLGFSVDHEQSWKDEAGKTRRTHVYGITNLYYEFLDGSSVDVSGTKLEHEPEKLWGGIGLGGSYNWNDDKYSLYGEVSTKTSLKSFADSYSVNGTVGFRIKF